MDYVKKAVHLARNASLAQEVRRSMAEEKVGGSAAVFHDEAVVVDWETLLTRLGRLV